MQIKDKLFELHKERFELNICVEKVLFEFLAKIAQTKKRKNLCKLKD